MAAILCRICNVEKTCPSSFYRRRRVCVDCYRQKSLAFFHRKKSGRRRSESAAWNGATARAARYDRLLRYFNSRRGWYETVLQMFFSDRTGYSLDFILKSVAAATPADSSRRIGNSDLTSLPGSVDS